MKSFIKFLLPNIFINTLRIIINKINLSKYNTNECNTDNLKQLDDDYCENIFNLSVINDDWRKNIANNTLFIDLPDDNEGINRGDQRTIYYLIKGFKINSVLEIGTHIGVSTFYFAKGLKEVNTDFILDTVDVIDVNDPKIKHWENFGASNSPLSILKSAGLASNVKFIKSDSVDYMKNCTQNYDLIFLDGSHRAEELYNEIPLALNLLNSDGIILLHDYYPNNKPIWDDNNIIPGPYLAIDRYINEGVNIKTISFGELPWITKHNSNLSSLAIVTKTN